MARHQVSGRRGLGFALATCTMLLWGMLPLALEFLLRRLDPLTLIGFRFAVAATGLAVVLAWGGGLPRLRELDGRGWQLLVLATLFLGANYWGYVLGLDWTDAASAQVLIQVAPLLLALGGLWLFGERFSGLQWLAFVVLVSGLGLFFAGRLLDLPDGDGRFLAGAGMMGLAAVTWAIYGLAQKQLLTRLSSQGIMLCIFSGCSVLFGPAARPGLLAALDPLSWGVLAFASLNTLLAYGAFAAALAHWEASRVSAVLALTPLATLGFGTLAHALWPVEVALEPLSPRALLGALLVVAGSMGVALGGSRLPTPVAAEPEPS